MRAVIVIGGSGFFGSAVIRQLHNKGYEIYAVQNKSIIDSKDDISIIVGGIKGLTAKRINEINPVAIFHCARPTFPYFRKLGRSIAAFKASRLNNYLLRQIEKSGIIAPLLFASGSLCYGNSINAHDEKSPLAPISYARQYLRGELPIVRASQKNNTPVIILRFPWLLGNGSWFSWFYLKNISEKNIVPLFGNGENYMSLIDVDDAAKLMVKYSENKIEGGVYNIFSPIHKTQKEFALQVSTHFDSEIVNYKKIYVNGLEVAAMEAFTSNIILTSNYQEIIKDFPFNNLTQTLAKVKD